MRNSHFNTAKQVLHETNKNIVKIVEERVKIVKS